MTIIARSAGDSGALFDLSGTISNNATWDELIYFTEAGVGMVLTGLTFRLQFREHPSDTSAALDLTTTDGELVIANDDAGLPTILRINVAYTVISGLEGDYIADLVSKDADDKLTHWASGVVTFKQSPIAF